MADDVNGFVRFFVGTYTGGESRGIYLCRFRPDSGSVDAEGAAAETPNPSFLTIHPDGTTLYAVNEVRRLSGQVQGLPPRLRGHSTG